jgi:hypothetical protein
MAVIPMKVHRFFKPIKITQATMQFGLQPWLETIYLIDDRELSRLSDWTVGYYHCKHCGAYQGFAHQIRDDGPSAKAHNERLDFMREHAHGDGRIALFERYMLDEPR